MPGTKKTSNVVIFRKLRHKRRFRELTDDDLLAIVKTDHYADLKDEFKPYLCSPKKLFKNSAFEFYDRALEESIEGSSAPLDGLFYLTCAVTLVGDTALGLTTGAFGLTILYGMYNYYTNKKRSMEIRQDHIHYFQLGELRLLAADIYLRRMQGDAEPIQVVSDVVAESKSVSDAKSVCMKVMSSFIKGVNTSTTLMVGYYLSAVWLFEAIQMAAISATLLTPVGLGIAIGVALCVGIYCGYRHYKTMKAKRDECVDLSGFKRGLFARNANSGSTSRHPAHACSAGTRAFTVA
jgi:hypothetical protein